MDYKEAIQEEIDIEKEISNRNKTVFLEQINRAKFLNNRFLEEIAFSHNASCRCGYCMEYLTRRLS